MKLTATQRKVIAAYTNMPDPTVEKVAKQSGIKSHTVRYIEKQFIDCGWLRPFYMINQSALGMRSYNMFFSIAPRQAGAAIKQLAADPRVSWLTEQEGSPRYAMSVVTSDPLSLGDLLETVGQKTGAQIEDRSWVVQGAIHGFGYRHLGNLKRSKPLFSLLLSAGRPGACFKLAALDLKIIDLFQTSWENCDLSVAELARRIREPQTTVAYRLKCLTESGVLSARYFGLDCQKAGVIEHEIVLATRAVQPGFRDDLMKFCGEHIAVRTMIEGFGSWDYKLVVASESNGEGLLIRDKIEREYFGMFSSVLLSTRRRLISAGAPLGNHPEIKPSRADVMGVER